MLSDSNETKRAQTKEGRNMLSDSNASVNIELMLYLLSEMHTPVYISTDSVILPQSSQLRKIIGTSETKRTQAKEG
jgi:hypothetical protein